MAQLLADVRREQERVGRRRKTKAGSRVALSGYDLNLDAINDRALASSKLQPYRGCHDNSANMFGSL